MAPSYPQVESLSLLFRKAFDNNNSKLWLWSDPNHFRTLSLSFGYAHVESANGCNSRSQISNNNGSECGVCRSVLWHTIFILKMQTIQPCSLANTQNWVIDMCYWKLFIDIARAAIKTVSISHYLHIKYASCSLVFAAAWNSWVTD